MPEGMARFRLGGVPEKASDIGKAFDIGPTREIEITPIGLGLPGEGSLEIVVALCPLQTVPHYILLHIR